MLIKTTMKLHFIVTIMEKQNLTIPTIEQDMKQPEVSYIADGNVNQQQTI